MATVSQAIIKWLKKNPTVEIVRIDTDFLQAREDSYGIYSAPTRSVKDYIDGSCEVTEYYNILIKQSNKTNTERLDTSEWLEELSYWIDDCGYSQIFPVLDGGRDCIDITLVTRPYPYETDGDATIYQMGIGISYNRRYRDINLEEE